jgi:hypothetical protein
MCHFLFGGFFNTPPWFDVRQKLAGTAKKCQELI